MSSGAMGVKSESEVGAMPKGYVIITEAIRDREGMDAYAAASYAPAVEHGAKILVVDENVEVLEGAWHGNRTVIVEFESVELARQWYHSASYQAVLPQRLAASECNAIIASGFVPKDPANALA